MEVKRKQEVAPSWGLFGGNRTVPLGDRFYCEKSVLFPFQTEGKVLFVWGNGTEPLYPNRLLLQTTTSSPRLSNLPQPTSKFPPL